MRNMHNIKEESKVQDVNIDIPKIYDALDNRKETNQYNMVEVQRNISNHPISILIDSWEIHSYISPKMAEIFQLKRSSHDKPWLNLLATGTKRKINAIVMGCPLNMNGLHTFAYLNIIPLGSYDMLIGMDQLDAHPIILDFHNKTLICLNE